MQFQGRFETKIERARVMEDDEVVRITESFLSTLPLINKV